MTDQNIQTYIQSSYRDKILTILNNQELSFIDREFYSESPNWYTNQDVKYMIDTLVWLSNTDKQKKDILDNELEEYFK